mmetsp:Transcript_24109/g.94991  ORF Transcript_24109/g.94991 Transcript_24109/m.94991 type:complete len:92 (+) Transcript_24109:1189-1464(+)
MIPEVKPTNAEEKNLAKPQAAPRYPKTIFRRSASHVRDKSDKLDLVMVMFALKKPQRNRLPTAIHNVVLKGNRTTLTQLVNMPSRITGFLP